VRPSGEYLKITCPSCGLKLASPTLEYLCTGTRYNQIDSKYYVLVGLQGDGLQESSSPTVDMPIMYSPFLLHPQSTSSQVTHMVIIFVSRIQF